MPHPSADGLCQTDCRRLLKTDPLWPGRHQGSTFRPALTVVAPVVVKLRQSSNSVLWQLIAWFVETTRTPLISHRATHVARWRLTSLRTGTGVGARLPGLRTCPTRTPLSGDRIRRGGAVDPDEGSFSPRSLGGHQLAM
jgi:hypothetical protein